MTNVRNVLFVCTANLCRSPMAEAVFNELAVERGLSVEALSAGVSARGGRDMAPNARQALVEIGVDPAWHSPRRITRQLLDESDLVFAMGSKHIEEIRRILGPEETDSKVRLLAEYAGDPVVHEVPDPYGLTLFAYRASARQIYGYIEKVLDRLERESSD